jgi:hypothetical protein
VGAWHITPPQTQVAVGDVLMAVNHGGEGHTFTEVEEFGGGIVPDLNQRMGLTTVAPECNAAAIIPPGGSSSETEEEEGVEKYQCCIPPLDAGGSARRQTLTPINDGRPCGGGARHVNR